MRVDLKVINYILGLPFLEFPGFHNCTLPAFAISRQTVMKWYIFFRRCYFLIKPLYIAINIHTYIHAQIHIHFISTRIIRVAYWANIFEKEKYTYYICIWLKLQTPWLAKGGFTSQSLSMLAIFGLVYTGRRLILIFQRHSDFSCWSPYESCDFSCTAAHFPREFICKSPFAAFLWVPLFYPTGSVFTKKLFPSTSVASNEIGELI